MRKYFINNYGFSVMEVLVVAAMFIIFFASIYQVLVFSTKSIHQSIRKVEAAYLVQEGIEAVRNLRDNGWDDNIGTLTEGSTYYPEISAGTWVLSLSDPGLINSLYTRTVILDEVYRDASDDIAAAGDLDPDSRKVTVKVNWLEGGVTSEEIIIETYITDFLSN